MVTLITAFVSHHAGCQFRRWYLTTRGRGQSPRNDAPQHSLKLLKLTSSFGEDECPGSTIEVFLDEMEFAESWQGEAAAEDSPHGKDEGSEQEQPRPLTVHDPMTVVVKLDMKFVDEDFLTSLGDLRAALMNVSSDIAERRDTELAFLSCHSRPAPQKNQIACSSILTGGYYLHVLTRPVKRVVHLSANLPGKEDSMDLIENMIKGFGVTPSPSRIVRHEWRQQYIGYEHSLPGTERDVYDIDKEFYEEPYRHMHKKLVHNEKSEFQWISIVDMVNTWTTSVDGYEKSLSSSDESYVSQHPEFYRPSRSLYLDGELQSTSRSEAAYHESLVHPGMIAHPTGAKRVAVVGGGEGATLREVLKHSTVETCLMLEIDPAMISAARDFLPELNDCSDFASEYVSCFDHPRADVREEDAFAWFMNQYGRGSLAEVEAPLDVIIIDALDPEANVTFADTLYSHTVFWESLHTSLTEDGVVIVQMGSAPHNQDVGEQFSYWSNRDKFLETIELVGFVSIFVYQETHLGFSAPWTFLVACKSSQSNERWYASPPETELQIRRRILRSRKTGGPALRYFDGALQSELQRPSRSWESVYCRKVPRPIECDIVESNKQSHAVGDSGFMKNAIGLSRLSHLWPLTKLLPKNGTLRDVSAFQPSVSHLSSPIAARHSTLLLAENLEALRN